MSILLTDEYIKKLNQLIGEVGQFAHEELNEKNHIPRLNGAINYLLGYLSAIGSMQNIETTPLIPKPTSVPKKEDKTFLPDPVKRKYKPRKSHPWNGGGEQSDHLQKIAGDTDVTNKPWSKNYAACIVCGTTKKKHMSGGRCTTCYFRKDKKPLEEDPEEKRSMKTPIGTAFCQNAKCPKGKVLRRKAEMYIVDDMTFCNKECSIEVLGKGEEVKE